VILALRDEMRNQACFSKRARNVHWGGFWGNIAQKEDILHQNQQNAGKTQNFERIMLKKQ
jgi:hypothetical protein